ncbi:MAG: hypothetical protein V1905_03295 [bacterium]
MEIFRAYDIRGEYPKDINDENIYKIARTLVKMFNARNVVVGRDVSLNTPNVHKALIDGLTDQGANVTDIGIAGTDVVYFAAGQYRFDIGIEITASHSAGHLSGIKIIGPNATPFGMGFGMEKLKKAFQDYQELSSDRKGEVVCKDIWQEFIEHTLSRVNYQKIKPVNIVVDASNAVGSLEVDQLIKRLPQVKVEKINWELDGHYPGHAPNPFLKENRKELVEAIKKSKVNFGVAFDGDADRIFFVDGRGDFIFGVYINVLIAEKMCLESPGRKILHDVRAIRYAREKITAAGGIPEMTLVGHAYFKKKMKEENAIFGAECTGHVYYNFGEYMVENSLLALLQVLEIVSEKDKSLRDLTIDARTKYPTIGEHNFTLPGFSATDELGPDAIEAMNKVLSALRDYYHDGDISDFDTFTVYYPEWNFNIRPSANDPLVRVTLEATNKNVLLRKKEEVFAFLKKEGCQFLNDTGVTLPEEN